MFLNVSWNVYGQSFLAEFKGNLRETVYFVVTGPLCFIVVTDTWLKVEWSIMRWIHKVPAITEDWKYVQENGK